MLRRFSGSGFALAMVAIVALRLPALGFCLCAQDLILNDGTCCVEPASDPVGCDCCPEEIAHSNDEPCDDCVVVLSLDPGEFTWSADQFSPTQEHGTPLALPVGFQDDLLGDSLPGGKAAPIRGSPRPDGPPLYLRTQVLKL